MRWLTPFRQSPTTKLVDRDLAKIDYYREELFEADADHLSICHLNMVGLRSKVQAFLKKLFRSASRRSIQSKRQHNSNVG